MARHKRLYQLVSRLLLLLLVTDRLMALPPPGPDSILHYKNAVLVLLSVILAGKMLYDTLFYDRYAPR